MKSTVIYGPPGTGKTRWLADELERRSGTLNPQKIAVVSFTRAAAAEIAGRVTGAPAMTIHSLCYQMLCLDKADVVTDAALKKDFAKRYGVKFSTRSAKARGADLEAGDMSLGLYNIARCERSDIGGVIKRAGYQPSLALSVIDKYNHWKRHCGRVDFADMLEACIRRDISPGYDCLFVDEAQDLSQLQIDLLYKWIDAGYVKELVLSGDDDQSLFEWGGSNPQGMPQIADKYQSEVITLHQSHRLPVSVFNVATSISDGIKRRVKKDFEPKYDVFGSVETIDIHDVRRILSHGADTLILYRTHFLGLDIRRILNEARIPYKALGGAPSILESKYGMVSKAWERFQQAKAAGRDLDSVKISDTAKKAMYDLAKRPDILYRKELGKPWQDVFKIPADIVRYLSAVYAKYGIGVKPTIKISTIHSAKGREADTVVLYNNITRKIRDDILRNGEDSERRVFYVGVTRAKKYLYIIRGERPVSWL